MFPSCIYYGCCFLCRLVSNSFPRLVPVSGISAISQYTSHALTQIYVVYLSLSSSLYKSLFLLFIRILFSLCFSCFLMYWLCNAMLTSSAPGEPEAMILTTQGVTTIANMGTRSLSLSILYPQILISLFFSHVFALLIICIYAHCFCLQ